MPSPTWLEKRNGSVHCWTPPSLPVTVSVSAGLFLRSVGRTGSCSDRRPQHSPSLPLPSFSKRGVARREESSLSRFHAVEGWGPQMIQGAGPCLPAPSHTSPHPRPTPSCQPGSANSQARHRLEGRTMDMTPPPCRTGTKCPTSFLAHSHLTIFLFLSRVFFLEKHLGREVISVQALQLR